MLGSHLVSAGTLQLRIGATRDKGFVFRACVRPPMSATVGRAEGALLPVRDPEAPDIHTLFSVGTSSCLLDFRPEWHLRLFRDEQAVTGSQLIEEGVAFRRGRRILLVMAPGTRGSLRFGATRLLFKWEVVPETSVGDVPLRDLGDVPRCHACGLALRDALAREGLFARCDACRAINRFVDPEAPYRRGKDQGADRGPGLLASLDSPPSDSGRVAALHEEADTMLGVPIFAPTTQGRLDPLPEYIRPAGIAGPPDTPPDLRAARAPMKALEGMQTVRSRSPFLGPRHPQRRPIPDAALAGASDPLRPAESLPPASPRQEDPVAPPPRVEPPAPSPPAPSGEPPEPPPPRAPVPAPRLAMTGAVRGGGGDAERVEPLDDAFYSAEPEAFALPASPPEGAPDGVDEGEPAVPWRTFSVLSASAEFRRAAGRIPKAAVEEALAAEHVGGGVGVGTTTALLVAVVGLGLLAVGLWLLPGILEQGRGGPASPVPAAVEEAPPVATQPLGSRPAPPAPSAAATLAVHIDRVRHAGGDLRRPAQGGEVQPPVPVGPFALDRFEVTAGDYGRFLGATGRPEPAAWALLRPPGGPRVPVTGVSVADARAYCAWTGGRLPSEPEWEFSAAGPEDGQQLSGGQALAKRAAVGGDLAEIGGHPHGRSWSGVEDLLGNAVEWVESADGGDALLKGGGTAPWNRREYLGVFARVPPGAERWTPGPGFRCAADVE